MRCEFKAQADAGPDQGRYKRTLPDEQIPFSATQGRTVFQEALTGGGMHSYFALAEQFQTQAEPTYCGISSLVMVLNALQVDPKRRWKGVWRWFNEDVADCCQQLVKIDKEGITLDRLAELGRCNGVDVVSVHADAHAESIETFRREVSRVTSRVVGDGVTGEALIASYSRATLGQTGNGHFSPIGGYHAAQDLVLIMDVARFKYPPHWVALPALWRAMQSVDADTGLSRGYLLIRANAPRTI
ncbi:MAG: phytochelatin synthase family protein [Rhodoferax sp.]|uniref:phytochelatin synthase family protein n=1 Tax=Rhodoferax sp. TaxID=50421 RepID=UPI00261AEE93|nr:phytochelatin synthase family protein [Rhodoferax sp.]MDD5332807.1 phytochelatin synthase family protein [Rhodoferax sp.]